MSLEFLELCVNNVFSTISYIYQGSESGHRWTYWSVSRFICALFVRNDKLQLSYAEEIRAKYEIRMVRFIFSEYL